ncbi:MAG: hypothetical protein ACM35G_15830, partial [Planctomycetaceae bacterium]
LRLPLRRRSNWPSGPGGAPNTQETPHAQIHVRTGPPPPLNRPIPPPTGPPLWDHLTLDQRQQLARLVGRLLARRLVTADRREANHDIH